MKEVTNIVPKYKVDKKNKEKQNPKRTRRKKKTHEQYVEEVKIKNPNVTVLGKYISSNTKILHKCNMCGKEWNSLPTSILSGHGCPSCSKRRTNLKKTHEEYVKEVQIKNPKVIVIGNYIDSETKILHKCSICGNEWKAIPNSILHGRGCPNCYLKKLKTPKKTHEQFVKKMSNINNTITIIGEYIGSNNPIKCKCNKCNYIWEPRAADILSGKGCPNCKSSHGEKMIKIFLENNKILFSQQKRYKGLLGIKNKKLSYDFYLPQYNLLIEFQGEQHEHPIEHFGGEEKFKVQQEHDKRKREYAKIHNIDLLEIWYYDINNIDEILTETLNNLKLETVETTGIA